MSAKKILVVNLNEFNYNYLKYGCKKYNLKHLKKFLHLKKISTFTKDKIQNKDLDPWVQSVSINTGKISKNHKIFKLGQKINSDLKFIWDILAKKNVDCYIWGPINAKFKNNKNIKLFFPDPWNYESKTYPPSLENLHKLPRYYAKNYLEIKISKLIQYLFIFFIAFIKNNGILFFVKNFFLIFKSLLKKGIKNYILFFLFDLISLDIFKKKAQSNKNCFSYIFLNSLAHFQHNNWNNLNDEKYYFIFVDQIIKYIFEIYSSYNSLFIFNGFTQNKISNEYLIRPINPKKFLEKLICFKNLEQDMTNGGYIFFKNKIFTNRAYKIIKNYKVCGINIFEVLQKKEVSFFYRIKIKSKQNLKDVNYKNFNSKLLSKNIISENNKNILKIKFNQNELSKFLNDIKFIKTTGIHSSNGEILYKNIKKIENIKSIENHKIFNIFKSYF